MDKEFKKKLLKEEKKMNAIYREVASVMEKNFQPCEGDKALLASCEGGCILAKMLQNFIDNYIAAMVESMDNYLILETIKRDTNEVLSRLVKYFTTGIKKALSEE